MVVYQVMVYNSNSLDSRNVVKGYGMMRWYVVFCVMSCAASELTRVKRLAKYAGEQLESRVIEDLMKQVTRETYSSLQSNQQPLLFKEYPGLADSISYVSLGDLPTPITQCATFGDRIGSSRLYVKNDGKIGRYVGTSRFIGGNKVRKLEFILADALAHGAKSIITFGCAGSNHVLTTSAYAKTLGLKTISVLRDQPNSSTVQRNLLLHLTYGTQVIYKPTKMTSYQEAAWQFQLHKQMGGTYPYIIPTGGSMPLGVLGYINAVFELKQQIDQGLMPEPKLIFVAAGSGGTSAGILLGLQAAGLSSKLVAIHVEPEEEPDEMKTLILALCKETSDYMRKRDTAFPEFNYTKKQFEVLTAFGGAGYGEPSKKALMLAEHLKKDEGIILDPTYSSKALLGMCSYIQEHGLEKEVVLFWNTFCGDIVSEDTDYKKLPKEFHKYFE